FRNTVTPIPLGPVLQAGIPETEATCRIANLSPMVTYRNNTFNEAVGMVDSSFFNLFDFEFQTGNKTSALASSNSIVLTEAMARKYFGTETAIGKNLELQLGDAKVLFTVSSVLKDLPLESTIRFSMLIPFANAVNIFSEKARTSAWSNVSVGTFVLLKKGADVGAVNSKIASVMNPLVAKDYKPGEYLVRLQPLNDWHFNSTLPAEMDKDSNPKYSYILATIGFLILLIACVNFVTLSIGRSATRALEVGVRKVLGADRRQLIRQFWGEAVLLAFAALVIGLLLAIIFNKPFNELAGRELFIAFDGFTVLFCFLVLCLIAFVAGIYPAIIMSGFKPIEVLKGKLNAGYRIGFFRRALVVGQFVASIVMIIGTFSVGKQLNYLQSKDLGYKREQVIIVPTNLPRKEGNQLAQRFRNELATNPQIISSTVSLYSMANDGWMSLGYTDNQNAFRSFRFNAIDADFLPAMGLQVVKGRAFAKDNPADSNAILVNEALVSEYGWKDPIGQKLPGKYEHTVLGVVKDFHFESLHATI
ncbi:MAG: FtsX-like permease family protein, partial [Chitinophagaceae bacterium]